MMIRGVVGVKYEMAVPVDPAQPTLVSPHLIHILVYMNVCKTRLIQEKTTIQIQKQDRNTTTKAITTTQIQVQVHKRRAACRALLLLAASAESAHPLSIAVGLSGLPV